MADRFYQLEVNDRPVFFDDFGSLVKIAGVIFQLQHKKLFACFPGASGPFTEWDDITIHEPTAHEWATMLRVSDDPKFYGQDKAWHRKIRYQISGLVQQKILRRDGYKCQACGREMGDVLLTIDHWIPLAAGGENNDTNYITLCSACNKQKGDMMPRLWCKKHRHDYSRMQKSATTRLT